MNEKMVNSDSENTNSFVENYDDKYLDLSFENILREYRKKMIHEALKKFQHKHCLEIGCGPYPLFIEFSDYEKMVVVEPGKLFSKMAKKQANSDSRIIIINDLIENVKDDLTQENFDFIVIGGFLHEIINPDLVLQAVRDICSPNTIIFSFVPNARSFHRLLAYEMGVIDSIYQKSEHDKLFQRQNVYDIYGFNNLLEKNKFKVIESGSYFIKPFTHDQMNKILDLGIIDKSCLNGLDKMIKFLPDLGAELFNICIKND